MFSLKRVKPHPKYILPCVGTTLGLYTLSHFANLLVNEILRVHNVVDPDGVLYQVNYMFSLNDAGNPMLTLFWNIIPYEYFYMFAALPIIALAFASMNTGYLISYIKNRKKAKAKTPEA